MLQFHVFSDVWFVFHFLYIPSYTPSQGLTLFRLIESSLCSICSFSCCALLKRVGNCFLRFLDKKGNIAQSPYGTFSLRSAGTLWKEGPCQQLVAEYFEWEPCVARVYIPRTSSFKFSSPVFPPSPTSKGQVYLLLTSHNLMVFSSANLFDSRFGFPWFLDFSWFSLLCSILRRLALKTWPSTQNFTP